MGSADAAVKDGATGAGIGFTVGGPWGAAIGGGLGAAYGYFGGGGDANRGQNEFRGVDPNGHMYNTAANAAQFGQLGQRGFAQAGLQNQQQIGALQALQNGQNSVSAEQLRQGLQQNVAGQMSMANSATPGNSAMAARSAMMNAGTQGAGLAGQQAVAGLAERNQATMNLSQILAQNQQAQLQAALGGQQGALQGYGNIENARTSRFNGLLGVPTAGEQDLSALQGLASAYAAGKGK